MYGVGIWHDTERRGVYMDMKEGKDEILRRGEIMLGEARAGHEKD
jgi:hypothetical protein